MKPSRNSSANDFYRNGLPANASRIRKTYGVDPTPEGLEQLNAEIPELAASCDGHD